MRRPITVAIRQDNAFAVALASAKNFLWFLADFMYGTPERVRVTYAFAFALALLGATMYGSSGPLVCAAP